MKFDNRDIAAISALPLVKLADIFAPYANRTAPRMARLAEEHPEKAIVTRRIAEDLMSRLKVLLELGVG